MHKSLQPDRRLRAPTASDSASPRLKTAVFPRVLAPVRVLSGVLRGVARNRTLSQVVAIATRYANRCFCRATLCDRIAIRSSRLFKLGQHVLDLLWVDLGEVLRFLPIVGDIKRVRYVADLHFHASPTSNLHNGGNLRGHEVRRYRCHVPAAVVRIRL